MSIPNLYIRKPGLREVMQIARVPKNKKVVSFYF